ncbi:NFX1-type zinc finger-containing protein 1, partial [Elysia marginata]
PAVLSDTILEAQLHQVNLFRHIRTLRRIVAELRGRFPDLPLLTNNIISFQGLDRDLRYFERWATQPRTVFTTQNERDSTLEHDRLRLLLSLLKILGLSYIRVEGGRLSDGQKADLITALRDLTAEGRTSSTVVDRCETLVDNLSKLMPESHIALTAQEKMDIVRAVNVSAGAWYQCPNNHIYAIGECGQAMEEARCPECQATIGGTNHRLRDDNARASQMDGADRPVWDNLDADRELAERLQRLEVRVK